MVESTPNGEVPDEELVAQFQADPRGVRGLGALDRLVERWRGRVYLWAYRTLGEREASLDAAQDALLQMMQALPRYQSQGRFSAWLFTIVRNRCLKSVRRRKLVRDPEVDLDSLLADAKAPDDALETDRERERLFRLMNEVLEPTERAAVWMRAFEEVSVEDITKMLDIAGASGARGVLQSARRKLRAAFARTDEAPPGRSA